MTSAGVLQLVLLVGLLAPLAAALLLWAIGHRLSAAPADVPAWRRGSAAAPRGPGEPLAGWIGLTALNVSVLCGVIALLVWAATPADLRPGLSLRADENALTWLSVGSARVSLGVQVDSLTIMLFVVISACGACVQAFSVAYMRGSQRFSHFFAGLCFFCFSMLGLIVSSNLLIIFIFWELVGISSYLLIAHDCDRPAAGNAARKAFVMNRIGDAGFLAAIGLCLAYLGTLSLHEAPAVFEAGARSAGLITEASAAAREVGGRAAERAAGLFTTHVAGISLATWLGLGLLIGAFGKSAQFPLHTWLADAMEGPTPVSALIHAATMVAAGVWLVARVFLLLTPEAQALLAAIGAASLLLGALLALAQTDVKRILAYSTLSQLGLMMFGLGMGAWVGALFHLVTHAFFKAFLFLGIGHVLVVSNHQQDIRRLGGLAARIPHTAGMFLIGALALCGVGLPFTALGLGSFYSKDEILTVALARCWGDGGFWQSGLLAMVVLAVFLTPLYIARLYVGVFLGESRTEPPREVGRAASTAAASRANGLVQTVPLQNVPLLTGPQTLLAALALVSGWFLCRAFVVYAAPESAAFARFGRADDAGIAGAHRAASLLTTLAWMGGLAAAWFQLRLARVVSLRGAAKSACERLRSVLADRLYFDELYDRLFVRPVAALGRAFHWIDARVLDAAGRGAARAMRGAALVAGRWVDDGGVDGAVRGVARVGAALGATAPEVQSGRLRSYVMLLLLSVAAGMVALTHAWLAVLLWLVGLVLLTMNPVLLALGFAALAAVMAGSAAPAAAIGAAGFAIVLMLTRPRASAGG